MTPTEASRSFAARVDKADSDGAGMVARDGYRNVQNGSSGQDTRRELKRPAGFGWSSDCLLTSCGETWSRRYRAGVHVQSFESVLAAVAARSDTNGIRVVSVDGPSGSGKSTLARRLAGVAGVPLIETDDFASWRDVTGWWPRFDQEVLGPLLAGQSAHFHVRDWHNDEFGSSLNGSKTVEWAPLLIIEGVTCSRSEAGDRLAYRIWVEAPDDLRLKRGVSRDGEIHRHLWLRWMREESAFFARDHTRDLADLIVLGAPDLPHNPDRELVVLEG